MELGCVSSAPRTVEETFKDYSAGIVRALTHDVNEFYAQFDPDKENLCLYGHSNDTWEVNLPAEEVPPELALGINIAREGMNRRDWLSLSSPCTVTRGSCRSRSTLGHASTGMRGMTAGELSSVASSGFILKQ